MKTKYLHVNVIGAVGVLIAGTACVAGAQASGDRCSLLTPAAVSAAAGVNVAAGTAIATTGCSWQSEKPHVIVTVSFPGPAMSGIFTKENPGVTKVHADGIGEDAVYITAGALTTLYVKHAKDILMVRVYGVPDHDKQKSIEKTLALDVLKEVVMMRSSALRLVLSTFSLALLSACNADKTLTPAAATRPDSLAPKVDTLAAKFPPLVGQIAFTSTRDGSPYIYVAAADGSSLRRLTKGQNPSWTWDGRQIVFNGMDYAGDSSIHVINTDGSGERVLQPGGVRPNLSPDGSRIAFTTELGLYVANSDGSNPTLLVSSDWQRPGESLGDAAWSPDGRRIAFVSGGDWWDDGIPPGVYVANVDGSGIIGTVEPGFVPRWSPDGSMMAFETLVYHDVSGNGPNPGSPPKTVVGVAKPDGSDMRVVDTTGTVHASSAEWSPDGRSLLLSPGHRIFVTDYTFQATRRLVPDAVAPTLRTYDDYDAVWSRVVVP